MNTVELGKLLMGSGTEQQDNRLLGGCIHPRIEWLDDCSDSQLEMLSGNHSNCRDASTVLVSRYIRYMLDVSFTCLQSVITHLT